MTKSCGTCKFAGFPVSANGRRLTRYAAPCLFGLPEKLPITGLPQIIKERLQEVYRQKIREIEKGGKLAMVRFVSSHEGDKCECYEKYEKPQV